MPAEAGTPSGKADRHALRNTRLRRFGYGLHLYVVVALGSVVGGTGRWLSSLALHGQFGDGFPWGTLAVNVVGSFLIGFYGTFTGPEGRLIAGPRQRQFVITGVFGGFTTFSIFSLESVQLVESARYLVAGIYVCVSVVGWMAAVWAGHALATAINRPERSRAGEDPNRH